MSPDRACLMEDLYKHEYRGRRNSCVLVVMYSMAELRDLPGLYVRTLDPYKIGINSE